MSFLSELKLKSEERQKDEVFVEITKKEEEIVEETEEEKSPEIVNIQTPSSSGPPVPPPPPLPQCTSELPSTPTLSTTPKSSSVQDELSKVTLKKTVSIDKKPNIHAANPAVDFNAMLLKRHSQLKNKEKVVTNFQITTKKTASEFFISKEKPSKLIVQKEMEEKWRVSFSEIKCPFVYCLIDQKDHKITVKGGILDVHEKKIEPFLKNLLTDAPGYSIINLIEKFSQIEKLTSFLLNSKEHIDQLYIKDYKDIKAFSYKNTVISVLSNLRLVKLKPTYQKNLGIFIQLLLNSIAKNQLKVFFKTSAMGDTILMTLSRQRQDETLTSILDFIFEHLKDDNDLNEIFTYQNEKKESLVSVASKNGLNLVVKRIAKYKVKDDVLLDEIINITNSKATKQFIEISKSLIHADYSMRLLDNILKGNLFNEDDLLKQLSNYKANSDKQRELNTFEKSIELGFENACLEMIKKEMVPIDYKIDSIPLLHFACGSAKTEKLALFLIERGISLNSMDFINETPLFYACRCGNLSLVKTIISDSSININHENMNDKTALNIAIANQKVDVVNYLKNECKASFNVPQYHKLPSDIMEYILTFVSTHQYDYLNFKLVNSDFYEYANSESLWSAFLFQRYKYSRIESLHGSFRISGFVLKQRELMSKFVDEKTKYKGIAFFASFHKISQWKDIESHKLFEQLAIVEKFDQKSIKNIKLYSKDFFSELENSILQAPKIATLPKDINWKDVSSPKEFEELLETGEISKDYIDKFKSCFILHENDAIDYLSNHLNFNKKLRFIYGSSMSNHGDHFMKQQISGKVFHYFCCASEDYIAILTSNTKVKQKKIDYKSLLKPIK
eukprot:gene10677-3298_t